MPFPFYENIRSNKTDDFTIFITSANSFPPHLHSDVELILALEGFVNVTINEKTKKLHKGDIAVCLPNDIHSFEKDELSKTLFIIFSSEIISSYFGNKVNKTLENPFVQKWDLEGSIVSLFNLLFDEYTTSKNKYVMKGLLYSIFGKLDAIFKFKDHDQSYTETTQRILKYIENHYFENISLDSIAKDLGYSKYHISRIFTNKIGCQFNDYINRLRINLAQKYLIETDMSILNICLACGFDSHRNFNRVFKDLIGYTPTVFRKQTTFI